MSLKLRLCLMITLLLFGVMLTGMTMMVENARKDVHAEVESAAMLANRMLDVQVLYLSAMSTLVWDTSPFHLRRLSNLRHLRIEFFDAQGNLVDSNQLDDGHPAESRVPAWFARLLTRGEWAGNAARRPIIFHGRLIGELAITPDVSYEITEVWEDTAGLMILMLGLFVVLNMMVYWAVWQALKPVQLIRQALSELEAGNLAARLPRFHLPELDGIAASFNEMASRLQLVQASNQRLTQQLINMQEQERKSLARNLHDELSQSLTTIQVEASAILGARRLQDARAGAEAILQQTRGMREMVRGILRNLRPGVLAEFGLRAALLELIAQWGEHHPRIAVEASIPQTLPELPEVVAVSAYRVVQECLTNVARHAGAEHVRVAMAIDAQRLALVIEDDGSGFEASVNAAGFGLAGMRERVEGLGGRFGIEAVIGHGVKVTADIPLALEAAS